jgi:hypothetical protein
VQLHPDFDSWARISIVFNTPESAFLGVSTPTFPAGTSHRFLYGGRKPLQHWERL